MDKKKKIAQKMQSKEYTTTRCGHCGKFGHHHSAHDKDEIVPHSFREGNKVIGGHFKIKKWGYVFPTRGDAEKYLKSHYEKNGVIHSAETMKDMGGGKSAETMYDMGGN